MRRRSGSVAWQAAAAAAFGPYLPFAGRFIAAGRLHRTEGQRNALHFGRLDDRKADRADLWSRRLAM